MGRLIVREILFRAKTEGGRWIEGDLIHYQSGEVAIIEKPFSKYGYEATEICRRTLVLPDTICQYTGLTDKNGNKIWENDVVLLDDEYWLVKWSDNDAQFTIEDDCTIEHFGNVWGADCEVYSNIFDNPDLLKGE